MVAFQVIAALAIVLVGASQACAGQLFDGAERPAPPAYHAFCNAYPALCHVAPTPPVELTENRLAELAAVQHEVNESIYWACDGLTDPKSDRWRVLPEGIFRPSGDCADFAMTKLAKLAAHGWPLSSLRPTMALLLAGAPALGLHMVLTVETDGGTFVLDHLHADVLPIDVPAFEAYYFFWRRGAGDTWHRVSR